MGEINSVMREERFSYDGVDYRIPRPSFESELMFETYLEDEAFNKITRRRFKMGRKPTGSISVCGREIVQLGSIPLLP